MSDERPEFAVMLSQNKYLSTSDTLMDAILVVTASGGSGADAAEVLLVDCSSSMDWPPSKIAAARKATVAAIDALRDDVLFAVVQGSGTARVVYPDQPRLVPANPQTRAGAHEAAKGLIASGGTAMSTWLTTAKRLLEPYPQRVRHAILLTDGRNESETSERLGLTLQECAGHFVCDARGIGDDWDVDELQGIARELQGRADAVVEEEELAADFEQMIEAAMGKVLPELRLRITIAPYSQVRFVKQVYPEMVELTGGLAEAGRRTVEVSTGPWGTETREYHVCLELDLAGRPMGEDLQLGRVELVEVAAGGHTPGEPIPILGYLTTDAALSSRIDGKVESYTVQGDLGDAVRAGWDAFQSGDRSEAAQQWGLAVRLATELGNTEILRRLAKIVLIEDAPAGRVRIKEDVRPRDGFSLVLGATITDFGADPDVGQVVPEQITGLDQTCTGCDWVSPADATLCVKCGRLFTEARS